MVNLGMPSKFKNIFVADGMEKLFVVKEKKIYTIGYGDNIHPKFQVLFAPQPTVASVHFHWNVRGQIRT